MAMFTSSQLRAIADALADTTEGLTGSEISHLLSLCKMLDTDPQITKRYRLYNAFAHSQNERRERTRILGFVRHAMKPERYIRETERYEPLRANLNWWPRPQSKSAHLEAMGPIVAARVKILTDSLVRWTWTR